MKIYNIHGDLLVDLQEANLRGANLRGANLQEANLQEANLYGADLSRANLRGANLQEANLQEANLYRADLSRANLYGADLSRANLRGANLQEANLQEANLRGADLRALKNKFIYTFQINSNHFGYYSDGYVKIGCLTDKLEKWISDACTIGKANKYTKENISLYKKQLLFIKDIVKSLEDRGTKL